VLDKGIEAKAREFRYNFFQELAMELGITKVVTAHHGDDLTETILMKLIRGSYLPHMSGILAKRKLGEIEIIRPLLKFSKMELETYLKEKEQDYIFDYSNKSKKYFRNRIRLDILPKIQHENPNYIQNMNIFSKDIVYLSEFLKETSEDFFKKNLYITDKTFVLKGLRKLNRSQRFVFITQVFEQYYQGKIVISQKQIEQILDGLEGKQFPLRIQLPKNKVLHLKSDELALFKA
jgi:tRNA(Ile)-lysidine synthase TilS/MesJ